MAEKELTIHVKAEIDEEKLYELTRQFLLTLADDMLTDAEVVAREDGTASFWDGAEFAANWLRAVANEEDAE